MSDERFSLALTPQEYLIIRTLREMPESPMKNRVVRLMDEIVTFARNPRCSEFQSDGVPCGSASNDCDTCTVVAEMLDVMAKQIPGNKA